ncbi:connector enhancer of kinase suppressor of ras 3-like [Convolutriloba macropyga]|uniref:connector enhancer of kinase suppressor of ras 3-like n=1 Tax=Convolutriloba macropyga TaxID=536237 RepID=UPI003F521099
MCSHYNIEFIKAQDLANWAAGLEPPLNSYASRFVETKCGSLATMLMDDELIDRSVVPKIGHLINMREKLAFLVRVLYDIKDETVESLVMKYQTGARSLETIIRRRRYEFAPQQVHSATRATVPNNVLSHVCDIMATGRDICSWLIKAPFSDGTGSYKELAETFMQNNREMGYSVVGDRWTHELEDLLVNQCRKMQELCHNFIENCTDSSIITPAFLEQVLVLNLRGNADIRTANTIFVCSEIGLLYIRFSNSRGAIRRPVSSHR